jgi:hypothetical protein
MSVGDDVGGSGSNGSEDPYLVFLSEEESKGEDPTSVGVAAVSLLSPRSALGDGGELELKPNLAESGRDEAQAKARLDVLKQFLKEPPPDAGKPLRLTEVSMGESGEPMGKALANALSAKSFYTKDVQPKSLSTGLEDFGDSYIQAYSATPDPLCVLPLEAHEAPDLAHVVLVCPIRFEVTEPVSEDEDSSAKVSKHRSESSGQMGGVFPATLPALSGFTNWRAKRGNGQGPEDFRAGICCGDSVELGDAAQGFSLKPKRWELLKFSPYKEASEQSHWESGIELEPGPDDEEKKKFGYGVVAIHCDVTPKEEVSESGGKGGSVSFFKSFLDPLVGDVGATPSDIWTAAVGQIKSPEGKPFSPESNFPGYVAIVSWFPSEDEESDRGSVYNGFFVLPSTVDEADAPELIKRAPLPSLVFKKGAAKQQNHDSRWDVLEMCDGNRGDVKAGGAWGVGQRRARTDDWGIRDFWNETGGATEKGGRKQPAPTEGGIWDEERRGHEKSRWPECRLLMTETRNRPVRALLYVASDQTKREDHDNKASRYLRRYVDSLTVSTFLTPALMLLCAEEWGYQIAAEKSALPRTGTGPTRRRAEEEAEWFTRLQRRFSWKEPITIGQPGHLEVKTIRERLSLDEQGERIRRDLQTALEVTETRDTKETNKAVELLTIVAVATGVAFGSATLASAVDIEAWQTHRAGVAAFGVTALVVTGVTIWVRKRRAMVRWKSWGVGVAVGVVAGILAGIPWVF